MSVSLFSNSVGATDPLSALYAPGTTAAATGVSSGTASPSASASSSTSISSDASLLSQLQQLSFSSPAAFKKATADIATQLQADAQQTGGSQGQALSSLAAKFQQASQTGDLSVLKPAHAHHGGHHHGGSPASAAAAYQQNDASSTGTNTSLQSQLTNAISTALTPDASTTPAA